MNEDFPLQHFFKKGTQGLQSPAVMNNNHEYQSQFFSLLSQNTTKAMPSPHSEQPIEGLSSEETLLATAEILNLLEAKIGPSKFKAFFKNTFTVSQILEDKVVCIVTTAFIKKMIDGHYQVVLKEAVEEVLGDNYEIETQIMKGRSEQRFENKDTDCLDDSEAAATPYRIHKAKSVKDMSFQFSEILPSRDDRHYQVQSEVLNHLHSGPRGQNLDSNKQFSNFIVGASNNMAHASCVAAARNPGKVYPCLYLHGNSGLGKTHLIHAVGNLIREKSPHLRIVITTANEFMAEMVEAIQNHKIQQFRKKYTDFVDVLMIDDIHELKNRPGTQNEFFHVFNELHSKEKQLIFTSDKHPKEINGIEERIRTRLSWGLVLDIQRPDFETRVAILKRKAQDEDIFVPDDVIAMIASTVKTSIRELEGSLVKLVAYASVFKVDIDIEIAKQQLKILEEHQERILSIHDLAEIVAQNYKVPIGDIRGKTRNKQVTLLRHLSMYLCQRHIKTTLAEIGEYFGGRDHTSVMHAIEKIHRQLQDVPSVEQLFEEIESLIK